MLLSTPPPKKKLEMIASKLACFIKQKNIFSTKKNETGNYFCYVHWHIPPKSRARAGSKQACCTKQTNIFI
jgi:hypothetical protein